MSFVVMTPGREVSGELETVFMTDGRRLCLLIDEDPA